MVDIFVVKFFMKVHSNSTMPINISINIKMDVPIVVILLSWVKVHSTR